MKIWVDDLREPEGPWVWCKDSYSALVLLKWAKTVGPQAIGEMSLDHDLGGDDTTRLIVLWMCENDYWPSKVVVHSANPVGREWLEGMIERYRPDEHR